MQHPPSRQNDSLSTIEIKDLTTENIPQNEPGNSRGCNYNLRPHPNSNYSEIYRYSFVQEFIPSLFMCHLYPLFFLTLLFFFSAHTSFSFYFGSKSIPKHKTSTIKIQNKTFSCKLNYMKFTMNKHQEISRPISSYQPPMLRKHHVEFLRGQFGDAEPVGDVVQVFSRG